MRDFIGDYLRIDGRMIDYRLVTARHYFKAKGLYETEEEEETYIENHWEIYELVNQIMALKQSCYVLRRTTHSCGSLSNDLYQLKIRLIHELRDQHQFEFDDDFVEKYGK